MKVTNTLVQKSEERQTFSAAVTGDKLQALIKKSVATPEAAARLTGTLISAVAASAQLQQCVPATVVAAALRGEGMGLSLGREYYLIPFRDTCAFVISYKGLIALCLAGNDVADMDCVEVREGEYVGRDRRTKRPAFDFSVYQTDEEAEKHPIIGYMAYCEMKNGYFRSEYMTVAEILHHAARYSKAFDVDKFTKLQNGALPPQEAEKLKQGSPYYSAPDVMFKKTVLRKLLNSGYIRLANSAVRDALNYDSSIEDAILPDMDFPAEKPVEVEASVSDTASEPANVPQSAAEEKPANDTPKTEKPAQEKKQGRRGRPVKAVDVQPDEDDAVASFFGE